MQVGAKSIGSSQVYVGSLVLAEPSVVSSDLSAGGVKGSYKFLVESHNNRFNRRLTTEASPEGNQVGSHVPAAS